MPWRGFAAVATAAALWGIAGVVAKSLFAGAVAPWTLVEIRLTAGFAMTLLLFLVQGWTVRLPRAVILRLIPLGLAMLAAQFFYYLTISLANVTTAIFLQYTAPALVVMYRTVVERVRLTVLQVASLAGALGGGYLLVAGPGGLAVSPLAAISGIGSALAFATWTILGRSRAQTVGSWHTLLYAMATGAVVWSVAVPPWKAYLQPTASDWGLIVFIVVAATVVPFALFLYGLRFISSSAASLTAMVEPVVAAVTAALLLGEGLTGRALLGAAMILTGVLLLQMPPSERPAVTGEPDGG